MKNIFTNKPVPEAIARLFNTPAIPTSGVTVTLTPADTAWYCYAALTKVLPMPPTKEKWVTTSIQAEGCYPIDISGMAQSDEVLFLDAMGLLIRQGEVVYISPLAEILYGPTGPFQMPVSLGDDKGISGLMSSISSWLRAPCGPPSSVGGGGPSMAQRQAALLPVVNFFRNYMLPGRAWRALRLSDELPKSLYDGAAMGQELTEVLSIIRQLDAVVATAAASEENVNVG